MLTREQFMAVYEYHAVRRTAGPRQGYYRHSEPVTQWVDWRAAWWRELEVWLAQIKMHEGAAQRGEGTEP